MVLEFLKTLAQSVYIHLCFFKKKWMFSFGLWSLAFPFVNGYFIVNPAVALYIPVLVSDICFFLLIFSECLCHGFWFSPLENLCFVPY